MCTDALWNDKVVKHCRALVFTWINWHIAQKEKFILEECIVWLWPAVWHCKRYFTTHVTMLLNKTRLTFLKKAHLLELSCKLRKLFTPSGSDDWSRFNFASDMKDEDDVEQKFNSFSQHQKESGQEEIMQQNGNCFTTILSNNHCVWTYFYAYLGFSYRNIWGWARKLRIR